MYLRGHNQPQILGSCETHQVVVGIIGKAVYDSQAVILNVQQAIFDRLAASEENLFWRRDNSAGAMYDVPVVNNVKCVTYIICTGEVFHFLTLKSSSDIFTYVYYAQPLSESYTQGYTKLSLVAAAETKS